MGITDIRRMKGVNIKEKNTLRLKDSIVRTKPNLVTCFLKLEHAMFYERWSFVKEYIKYSWEVTDRGINWDEKKRLKVYEAVHSMFIRNFDRAAKLFLEIISAFTSSYLMNYEQCVFYCVISSMISFDRAHLKTNIIESPEILSVIDCLPHLGPLLTSFYNCDYSYFFHCLSELSPYLISDWLFNHHNQYYLSEIRLRAYIQLLESYSAIRLDSMSTETGLSSEFLDHELWNFIAAGRLHCKIDKVGGIIIRTQTYDSHSIYRRSIRQADLILSRIQKITNLVEMRHFN